MKHLVIILIGTLLGFQSMAQHSLREIGDPILPYKENGYSVAEVKTFAQSYCPRGDWFRKNMLTLINQGLMVSGEELRVTENNIDWIFQRVTYEHVILDPGFENSRAFGDVCDFYKDRRGFDGMVGVFRYGNCVLPFYKKECVNLFKFNQKITQISQTDPVIPAPAKKDTVYIKDTVFLKPVIPDVVPKSDAYREPTIVYLEREQYTEDYREERRGGGLQIFFTLGGRGRNQGYYPQQQGYDIRTMPPGIPSGSGGNGGGIPAPRRSMPGGIPWHP